MPSRGTQASSLEQGCVWAGSSASAAVQLPVPSQVWLFPCRLGVECGLREQPYNWCHTQPRIESPPSDLPRWDDDGPKSQELWFALATWLLRLPQTHCKAVPVASSLKCKAQSYAARISPSELRESNLIQIYLKSCLVVWILLRFPKSRIPTLHVLTFSLIPFSVFLLSCNSRDLSCSSLRMPLEWHVPCKREDVEQMETQRGRVYVAF